MSTLAATNYYRGRTLKTVRVDGVRPSTPDEAVVRVALTAARETPDSLFGIHVERHHDPIDDARWAVVTLHTD